MTFLNPAILWGLAAISVPIILHFFNLQRPKQVLFSNISFVKKVQKTVVRRVKFKQWLLLLARILAIAALVLAFANPVIIQEDNALFNGSRSVAIVVDNSYSMQAGNERGAYFQQANALARDIIQAYSLKDEFLLMGTHELRLNSNFSDQENALENLKTLDIQQNTRSHKEILSFIPQIFSRSNNYLNELYVISDFQQSTMMADSLNVQLSDSNLIVKYIPLASRKQKNIFIENHAIESQIIEKGQAVQLSMDLVNDGSDAVSDLKVQVFLNGEPSAFVTPNLSPNSKEKIDIPIVPKQSGWLEGYISLDDYPIEYDNQRYFSLYVPEQEKILIVEGTASENITILYESLFDAFEPTFIAEKGVSSVQFQDYRSIVLLGIKNITTGLNDRLKSFLDEGGSIFMILGPELEIDQANEFMKAVNAGQLASELTINGEGSPANEVELEHPVFDGIFTAERTKREFDAPLIKRYYPFQPDNSSVYNHVIQLGKQPVLSEIKTGNGLMYLMTTFPEDGWTDFHLKTAFAPILLRTTQIMNQTQSVSVAQTIGEYNNQLVRTSIKDLVKLRDQAGQEFIPEQYVQAGGISLNFAPLELREGNYDLIQEEELLEKIAFNISGRESQLAFPSRSSLKNSLKKEGFDNIEVIEGQSSQISERIKLEQEGTPLWKYFLIGGILFLIFEILILKFLKEA